MRREIKYALILSAAAGVIAARILRRRRLEAYRAAVAERAARTPAEDAWTADGYLRNQDALSAYTYRTLPACDNGCGPVAVFDLLRFAEQDVPFGDVLREMDGMHLLHAPGPTRMRVLRRYLKARLPGGREVRGRAAALAAARRCRMGVFRYREQGVPHFVACCRMPDGLLRFFNVSDGAEDARMTADAFAAGHLKGGGVRFLYWE